MVQNIVNLPTYEQSEDIQAKADAILAKSGYFIDGDGEIYTPIMKEEFGILNKQDTAGTNGYILRDGDFLYFQIGIRYCKYSISQRKVLLFTDMDVNFVARSYQNDTHIFTVYAIDIFKINKATMLTTKHTYPGFQFNCITVDNDFVYGNAILNNTSYYSLKINLNTMVETLRLLTTSAVYSMAGEGSYIYTFGQALKIRKHNKSDLALVKESAGHATAYYPYPGMQIKDGVIYTISNGINIFRNDLATLANMPAVNITTTVLNFYVGDDYYYILSPRQFALVDKVTLGKVRTFNFTTVEIYGIAIVGEKNYVVADGNMNELGTQFSVTGYAKEVQP